MNYRKLGGTGLKVSEVGFGGWSLGGGWGPTDEAEAVRAVERAHELGVRFFDTALGYGNGKSEELLGRALAGRDAVIATKVPPKNSTWPVHDDVPVNETFPADWVVECGEKSLKYLGRDRIDVLQLHAWTPRYLRERAWLEGMERLKRSGKVRHIGVSVNDWDPYNSVGLIESGLIDTVQVIYNLFEQRPAERLLPAALEHGVGVIVRVPFEEGMLTGRLGPGTAFAEGDWRAKWLTSERLAEIPGHLEDVKGLLTDRVRTPAQAALRFVLAHEAVSTVIPGMRKTVHVEENASVSDGWKPPADWLESAGKCAWVHGWAYPWAAPPPGKSHH